MEPTPKDLDKVAKLKGQIAALEAELARYAHRYGLTDEARRLLSSPDVWQVD